MDDEEQVAYCYHFYLPHLTSLSSSFLPPFRIKE